MVRDNPNESSGETSRNYSKKVDDKKQARRIKKKIKKEKIKNLPKWRKVLRIIRKGFNTFLIIGVLTTGVVTAIVWHKYGDMVQVSVTDGFKIADGIKDTDFIQHKPTLIYDANGKVLKELKQYEYDAPNYSDINPYFLKGVVAVEDSRFYKHHGVDLYGTLRSVVTTLTGGSVQGGSTLTQQLVRNAILHDSTVTVERKLKEQVIAQEIEKKFSKKEILQHYLNNVYFGHGNYGIGPASQYYFGKDQSKLTVDEVAVIIGITNNPSLFDPINKPENALKKRNRILKTFLKSNIISSKEYKELIKKPITLNVTERKIDNSLNNNFAVSFAVHKATQDLMKKDGFIFQYVFDNEKEYRKYHEAYQEEYSKIRQHIINGGYDIRTSIDMNVQNKLEKVVQQETKYYGSKTEIALTTVDNKTGEVIGIVGGRNKGEYFNRAYQAARQPGSAAKPIVVYTNAFEMGYNPQSILVDRPIKNGPTNWYSGYRGSMTIRYALEQSVNTVAFLLANRVGVDTFMDKLERMQFSYLTPTDQNAIIALGGFTKGVTTVEMASAYSTLVRSGDFIEPTNVREIKDIVTGKNIVKNEHKKNNVFREDSSYMMIDTLKSVIKNGTGKLAKPSNYKYVFGKTGTTNSNKDSYFAGGTPYYTTAIWVGHDRPSPLTNNELDLPKVVFREWNEVLHQGKEQKDFKQPDSVYRSGNSLYSRVKSYDDLQIVRERNEENRLKEEREAQQKRLALEDYRIIYGLTFEEEKAREEKAEQAIVEAENFEMKKLEDYDVWVELIEKAKKLNEEVKHQEAKEIFQNRINHLEVRSAMEKENMIQEIKRKEEEAKRLEEQRKKEQEEIQVMQDELDEWINKINNGDSLSKSEIQMVRELIQKLKNKGVSVPNIVLVEPKETEEDNQLIESKDEERNKEEVKTDNNTVDKEESNISSNHTNDSSLQKPEKSKSSNSKTSNQDNKQSPDSKKQNENKMNQSTQTKNTQHNTYISNQTE